MVSGIFKITLAVTAFVWIQKNVCCQQNILDSWYARQVVLVVVDTERSTEGNLNFYTRNDSLSPWKLSLTNIPVTVGKNGSAWGKGLQPDTWISGPLKKEGDGKAPRGVFYLGQAFGYGPVDTTIQRIYSELDEATLCVDDPNSHYYNQIISTHYVSPDWKSAETMLRSDHLYKWGMQVNYNYEKRESNAGSCIFLHIWRKPGSPTAGCTAMSEENLLLVMHQFIWNTAGVYILLTHQEYQKHKTALGLP